MSAAAAGAGSGSGNDRNARTREVHNAVMFLNRVASKHHTTEELARIVNEMFSYLVTTNHILLNEKFFNTVVDKINELVDEKPEIYSLIKDSLASLCEKMRSIHPDVEIRGCHEPASAASPSYKKLGSGGFGAVISPALPNTKNGTTVEFPGNVTKIFFKRRDKQNLLEKLPTIQRVMGSYPEHRVNNYSRSYRFQNLPPNAQHILRNASRRQILPTNTMHVVHMPYLGIDISDKNLRAHYKQLRKIPVEKIIEEIVKLISQTCHLAESGYIHGDVREPNIMINPETGVITIIDFDWVKTYNDFMNSYPFGFYSNPPEYLLYDNFSDINGLSYINTDIIEEYIDDKQFNTYIADQYNRIVFWKHAMNFRQRDAFRTHILDALVNNTRILQHSVVDIQHNYYNTEDAIKDIFTNNLNTFDNFGLATSLLSMFSYLYSESITLHDISSEEPPEVNEGIKESLRGRISKHGIPYSEAELDAIVTALRKLSYLLYLMASTDLSFRPSPAQALREAQAIKAEFDANLVAANSNTAGNELRRMAVIAGNLSALPTLNGGGRRTRRRVLKRKKTRRSRPAK